MGIGRAAWRSKKSEAKTQRYTGPVVNRGPYGMLDAHRLDFSLGGYKIRGLSLVVDAVFS